MTNPVDYIDHDFRPAAPGWQAVYLNETGDPAVSVTDLAGWLIQLESRYDPHFFTDDDTRPRSERPRRIVAATIDQDGTLYPCCDDDNFWGILAPSTPLPTKTQVVGDLTRRRALRERYSVRAAKEAS